MSSIIEISQIKSVTSQIDILNLPKDQFVEVIEFDDEGVAYQFKDAKIGVGQVVSVIARIRLDAEILPFTFTGKIAGVSESGDGLKKVNVHFHQYNKDIWGRFLSHKKADQDRVSKLLTAMKGED